MMTMFPGQPHDEDLDAGRFADALDVLEAGGDPGMDPIEDPELVSLLAAVEEARGSWGAAAPRDGYRVRSRALLMAAYSQEHPETQPRRRRLPFFLRPAFLAPLGSAAAAAAITLGFALAGDTLDDRDSAVSVLPVDNEQPTTVLSVPTEEPQSVTNLTSQSALDELDRIQVALREIELRTQQGQPVDPSLLRAVTESTVTVANRIESEPEAVPELLVVTYIQAASTSRTVLETAQVETGDQAALNTARQAAQDGMEVASNYFLMLSQ